LNVVIKINNRKILSGIAAYIGAADLITDITVAIDKLDKIGKEKVIEELREKGLSDEALAKVEPLLDFKPITVMGKETIDYLNQLIGNTAIGQRGINELATIFDYTLKIPLQSAKFEFDLTLARGLNYYTGAIFEVKLNDARSNYTGSLSGGGRYDDLTGIFGLPNLSGVGISFGADRIYNILDSLNLFPTENLSNIKVMIANFGNATSDFCLRLLHSLRQQGITSIFYPEEVKMKKQFEYAHALAIPYVIIIGDDEMKEEKVSIKTLETGEQEKLSLHQLTSKLKGKTT
jgi:histidyl-tRNA synthetase